MLRTLVQPGTFVHGPAGPESRAGQFARRLPQPSITSAERLLLALAPEGLLGLEALVLLAAAALGAARLGSVITSSDPALWLAAGDHLMGRQVLTNPPTYPPAAPVFAYLLARLLGPLAAVQALTVIAWLAAAAGIAFAASRLIPRSAMCFACGLFLLSSIALASAASAQYGALLAAPCLLFGTVSLAGYVRRPTRAAVFASALGLGLACWASYVAIPIGATLLLLAAWTRRQFGEAVPGRRLRDLAGLALLISLPGLMPLWSWATQATGVRPHLFPALLPQSVLFGYLRFVASLPPVLLLELASAIVAGSIARRRLSPLARQLLPSLGVALAVGCGASGFSPELLPLLSAWAVLTLTAALWKLLDPYLHGWRRGSIPAVALMAATLLAFAVGGAVDFGAALTSYGAMSPDAAGVLGWLAQHTSPSARIVASEASPRSSLAPWIAAVSNRLVLLSEPSPLQAGDPSATAAIVHGLLSAPNEQTSVQLARDYGVNYVVLGRAAMPDQWLNWGHQLPDQLHYDVAFRNDGYAVLEVQPPALTTRQQAIADLYRTVLGREPDISGLRSYDQGGLDLRVVETELICSKESELAHPDRAQQCAQRLGTDRGRGQEIADLYRTILGREPDVPGLQWYLARPMTVAEIRRDMFCSPESIANFPDRAGQCRAGGAPGPAPTPAAPSPADLVRGLLPR